MDDAVLNNIGRKHTAADVLSAIGTARRVGGFSINMDLIAGLLGDSAAGFRNTLDQVIKLSPENITIHTLSRKKGSDGYFAGNQPPDGDSVGEMLSFAARTLRAAEYEPYYLYRQKFMAGGFENVGWSRKGFENLYNMCIMEELCSIISLGGGASTKLVSNGGSIARIFNPKYPKEYIDGIERVISKKEKIGVFYSGV
jgi:oxygen-independent coproporphyrinogen-3 oxidase